MKKARNLLILALITIVIMLIIKVQSANNTRPLATDFPRGVLVFAKFSDLPGMLQSWNGSELKERYLSSTNYKQFTNRHLATKLIERFSEFSMALGFEVNDQLLKELSQQEAAIALYDIGRLEFVFIAPLDQEKFLLSKLIENKSNFEEVQLKSGISYFVIELEVDRGRQKQRLAFALEEGRFILANNEQLMIRTLNNVITKVTSQSTDRLTSEPTYQALSKKVKPHYATIWVAQEKLNQNFYFRNYWIMKNLTDLQNICAAIFDIELQEKEWKEERYFLTKSNQRAKEISPSNLQHIYQLVPNTLPYFKIEATNSSDKLSSTLHKYFFDNDLAPQKRTNQKSYYSYYSDTSQSEPENFYSDDYSGYYLYGDTYSIEINDPVDAEDLEVTPESSYYDRQIVLENINQILKVTQPQAIATMQQPQAIDSPLFAEFNKAFIINLENPTQFDNVAFETAIAKLASDSTMIAGNSARLSWQYIDNKQVRVLAMPMLGWQLCYSLKGKDLIFSNNISLLKEILNGVKAKKLSSITSKPLSNLTLIKLSNREQAFDEIFNKIQGDSMDSYHQTHASEAQDFFVGNIASLLDTISPVEAIVITRDSSPGQLHELIQIKLKEKQ